MATVVRPQATNQSAICSKSLGEGAEAADGFGVAVRRYGHPQFGRMHVDARRVEVHLPRGFLEGEFSCYRPGCWLWLLDVF